MSKHKKQKSAKQIAQPLVILNPTYIAYFDGSCGPKNPGGTAAYGAFILREGQPIWECSKLFHPEQSKERETSNNLAEYCALITVLEYLIDLGAQHEPIMVYGDSELVIDQMFGHKKIGLDHRIGLFRPLSIMA